jgi:hypothetical protein
MRSPTDHASIRNNSGLPEGPDPPADLLFLDLLDFREEVPEPGNTTSASAG